MGRNIILTDFDTNNEWSFKKALEEATNEKWTVVSYASNWMHGGMLKKLKRYLAYFSFPFQIFVNRSQYRKIVAWQQFYGLILAFYFRLFHIINAPELVVMTFIYKPKKGILGTIYRAFMNYIVKSGYIKKFIVFSKSESAYYADLFGVSEQYFLSETLGIEDVAKKYQNISVNRDVYFAPGRSNRDYEWLRKAWEKAVYKLEIICDTEKERNTENITYFTDCRGEQYMERLASSYAVVIPLKDERISSGELVILQAMMLGKPVIATKNIAVSEYIMDGFDGLVIEKNEKSLADAILELGGQNVMRLYQKMREAHMKINLAFMQWG